MSTPVARTWTARATKDGARAYVAYFRDTLAPALAARNGYIGATIFESERGGVVELVVITRWHTLAAIRAFAGDDYERAVVEPEARALLTSFDDRARHSNIALDVTASRLF